MMKLLLSALRKAVLLLVLLFGFLSLFLLSVIVLTMADLRFTRAEVSYNEFIGFVESEQFEKLSVKHPVLRDRFGRRMLVFKLLQPSFYDSAEVAQNDCYVLLPDSYTDQRHEAVLLRASSSVSTRVEEYHSRHGFVDATHVAIAIPCSVLLLIALHRKTIQRSVRRMQRTSCALLGLVLCSLLFAAGLFFGSL